MKAQRVRFTDGDLRLFSRASYDRNALHLSDDYARRTAFGEPVVFGVLGVLASLSALHRRAGSTATRMVFEFSQPMFKEVDYGVEIQELSAEQTNVGLHDGSRPLLRGTIAFSGVASRPPVWSPPRGDSPPTARGSDPASPLQRGSRLAGEYAPEARGLAAILERFGLQEAPVSVAAVAALLWSSYAVGMHLPGERALLSRISIDFEIGAMPVSGSILYEAEVMGRDPATGLLRTRLKLGPPDAPWARGELRAFERFPARQIAAAAADGVRAPGTGSRALAGKVALIVGASRGLGAAWASCLAAEGCTVIAVSRSGERVQPADGSLPPGAGTIIPLAGDGADSSFCAELAALLRRDHRRLDFLFCNAAPPLRPLWLDPGAADRIGDYVHRSTMLAAVPMAALLPLLESNGGWLVFSSATAVCQPPAEAPHYVAAKLAIEGLIAAAVAEYPGVNGLIVRYPRLLTDFVSHLSGARATPPEEIVPRVLERLTGPAAPGRCEVLEIP